MRGTFLTSREKNEHVQTFDQPSFPTRCNGLSTHICARGLLGPNLRRLEQAKAIVKVMDVSFISLTPASTGFISDALGIEKSHNCSSSVFHSACNVRYK